MSFGSSGMAQSAPGTAFSLLLLTYIIQGLQDVEVFHYAEMEAVVGQDVAIPCTVKNTNLQIVSIEWRKNRNENTKLVLYSPELGTIQFWSNVSIKVENNSMGSSLLLHGVTKWSDDSYICDLTTFPLGQIRRQTTLKIKDVDAKIQCGVESPVEVHAGENVTIKCIALPNAQYRWTKNKTLVSENESLQLLWVTDAHAGVYALTVNTGNKSLLKEFIITVLTATTSLQMDPVTVPRHSNVTEKGLIESTDSRHTTLPTTEQSTTDANVISTMSMGSDITDNPNPSKVITTPGVNVTSSMNYTQTRVTLSPAAHTDPYHVTVSTDPEINSTHTLNTSSFADQLVASDLPISTGSTVFASTKERRNESMLHSVHPEVKSSTSPEETSILSGVMENSDSPGLTSTLRDVNMEVIDKEDTDGVQRYLLPVLIIIPVLLLITVAGFLYRKHIIKKRMDLPPPFKPPPPPVKYTAARHSEISAQLVPMSRCKFSNRTCRYETKVY